MGCGESNKRLWNIMGDRFGLCINRIRSVDCNYEREGVEGEALGLTRDE
jgi:hypothetical protein